MDTVWSLGGKKLNVNLNMISADSSSTRLNCCSNELVGSSEHYTRNQDESLEVKLLLIVHWQMLDILMRSQPHYQPALIQTHHSITLYKICFARIWYILHDCTQFASYEVSSGGRLQTGVTHMGRKTSWGWAAPLFSAVSGNPAGQTGQSEWAKHWVEWL